MTNLASSFVTPGAHASLRASSEIRMSDVMSALSFALDLTEGQPLGHSVRACVIGMSIAEELGMKSKERADLYYGLLMKDAGCSSNASRMFQIMGADDIAAKRDIKTTDWTHLGWESLQYAISHVKTGASFVDRVRAIAAIGLNKKENARELVQIRCERGAEIARRVGMPEGVAEAIMSLDELWNGRGQPLGLRGAKIPLLSRIMSLSQTAEVYYTSKGRGAAIQVVQERTGTWFDPQLCRVFSSLASSEAFWNDLAWAQTRVTDLEPKEEPLLANDTRLDSVCLAFADVIDAKSPFTYRHSTGVTGVALAAAQTIGMTQNEMKDLRRAALLHDIGKLGISNAILDKPSKLDQREWTLVKKHPNYTFQILRQVPGFRDLTEVAASHHEKLDGSGYYRGLIAPQMDKSARLLAVANAFDALSSKRAYRDAFPQDQVLQIMQQNVPHALDADCFEAVKSSCGEADGITADLLAHSLNFTDHEQ